MSPKYRPRIFLSALSLVVFTLLIRTGHGQATPPGKNQKQSRIDSPFTLAVETPHIAWGRPSPGGPVCAFAVPSVSEGRTLIKLFERFDMKADTVMIDDAWDVNTWTVGTDKNYEVRNYRLAYKYLEEDLKATIHYDVIILPGLFGWNRLPQATRDSIRKRVAAGTGLILIHPTTGLPAPDDPHVTGPMNDFAPSREVAPGEELWDLSPLVGVLSDRIDARGFREIRPDATANGPWKSVSGHFITENVPFESFPTEPLKHYKYMLGKDSTTLVTGPGGEPIVATKMYGKGRVVALGYVNSGISPTIEWKSALERPNQNDRWWEYLYSLLGRSILWAAGREPLMTLGSLTVGPVVAGQSGKRKLSVQFENHAPNAAAKIAVTVTDEWGNKEQSIERAVGLKQGRNGIDLMLPPAKSAGRHFVDVILTANGKHYDWGSISFDCPKPDEMVSLSTDKLFYSRGDLIQVKWATKLGIPENVIAELMDNRGRLLAVGYADNVKQPSSDNILTLKVGNYSTNIGWVRLALMGAEPNGATLDRRQVRVNFASLDRDFGAYELIMPWYGPPTYQPWTPTLD